MNINILEDIKQKEGDPLSQLQQMVSSTINGEAESPMEFLMNGAFSQVELEIPVGYGVTISVYLPQRLLDEVQSELDWFILDKLLNKGGALYMAVKWVEIGLINVLVYVNSRTGLAIFINTANGQVVNSTMIDVVTKVANTLVSMSNDSNIDINVFEWGRLEEFFNRIYYSGLLRTSQDNRYIEFKVKI